MVAITDTRTGRLGRRETNKVEKRERLTAAARLLFRTQGLEATSVAAIAKMADVAAGTFYLYFSSKEDLLIEVFRDDVERIWRDAFGLLRASDPVADQLLGIFERATAGHDQDPELSAVYFREIHFVSDPVRETVMSLSATIMERLEKVVNRAVARGELSDRAEVPVLVRMFFELWFCSMLIHYGHREPAEQTLENLARPLRSTLALLTPG